MNSSQSNDVVPTRPVDIIKNLYNKFKCYGEPFSLPSGQLLERKKSGRELFIYFFTSGIFSTYRYSDQLQLLSSIADENTITLYGLIEVLQEEKLFSLRTESPCEGIRVPARYLMNCQDDAELWMDIAKVVAYFVKIAIIRDQQLVGVTSYHIIRHQLISLMAYPESLRIKINIKDFIRERSRLSRSNILRILGELQNGGYITIKRGKLIDIKYLPLDF